MAGGSPRQLQSLRISARLRLPETDSDLTGVTPMAVLRLIICAAPCCEVADLRGKRQAGECPQSMKRYGEAGTMRQAFFVPLFVLAYLCAYALLIARGRQCLHRRPKPLFRQRP